MCIRDRRTQAEDLETFLLVPDLGRVLADASLQRLRAGLDARTSTAPAAVIHYPQGSHGFLGKTKEASPGDYESSLTSWPVTTAFLNAALATG